MFYFLMKKIATDTSSQEIARIREILTRNKIRFEVNPVRSQSTTGTYLDARSYARANIALYKNSATPTFVYYVYVWPKDYQRAFALLYEK